MKKSELKAELERLTRANTRLKEALAAAITLEVAHAPKWPPLNREDVHPAPLVFRLRRNADVSRVSGTGDVAHGVLFGDGRAALRWRAKSGQTSTACWDSMDALMKVHGHAGATVAEFADGTQWVPLPTADDLNGLAYGTRTVAYRGPASGKLYCLSCASFYIRQGEGLTSGDLPDGGICRKCDRDVLAVSKEDFSV